MQLGDYYGQVGAEVSTLTASAGSSVILYPDNNRLKVSFFNAAAAPVFIKFGNGAAENDFSIKLAVGEYFETLPPVHTGSITGIWNNDVAQSGSLMITKYGIG